MVEKEGKSPFAQSDRPSSDLAVVQTHLNLRRTSGSADSSHKVLRTLVARIIPFHDLHQSPRRTPTTDASHLASPSFTPKLPHPASRPPFSPADTDTGRDHPQRIAQSSSRPPSPFKSSDRSSNSPDRSHTRALLAFSCSLSYCGPDFAAESYTQRTSIDVSEGTNSGMSSMSTFTTPSARANVLLAQLRSQPCIPPVIPSINPLRLVSLLPAILRLKVGLVLSLVNLN